MGASILLVPDGTCVPRHVGRRRRRPPHQALEAAVAEVRAGRVECARVAPPEPRRRNGQNVLSSDRGGSGMEGGFGFPFGGDPEEIMRGLQEFAAQQTEAMASAQKEQFATLTLNTAVQLTAAALAQIKGEGGVDQQAIALRDAMRVLFPESVALVSAARQGFMREA
jgi:hypothetical protein